eukprot:SAG22_NODE_3588_length_1629_cov_3.615162_2_plen_352_part_01
MALRAAARRGSTCSTGGHALQPASCTAARPAAWHCGRRALSAAANSGGSPAAPLPTNESSPRLLALRHTASHVLAMAVQRLFPETQVTIGPWTETGFFYDFFRPDSAAGFTEADLKVIKKEMDAIVKQDLPLVREVVSRDEARARITELSEPYKLEILDSIPAGQPITLYHTGDSWWDLCAGPHVESTGAIKPKALSLDSTAATHWRGDTGGGPMLQRITGTAWETKQQLTQHKKLVAEAKRRDHRVLGQQLDLFSIQDQAGSGLVFWHPKGAAVRSRLESFWQQEHERAGYQTVYSPHVADAALWDKSGHLDFYADGMFGRITNNADGRQFQLRPMNCPMHCLMFAARPKS